MTLDSLIPRLELIVEKYPREQVAGVVQGVLELFGYKNIPEDFITYDVFEGKITVNVDCKYVDEYGTITFPSVKEKCIVCGAEDEPQFGFNTRKGFVCVKHNIEDMDVFIVKQDGMGDLVYQYEFDAEDFIQAEVEDDNENTDYSDYTINKVTMGVVEFYDLEDWDG